MAIDLKGFQRKYLRGLAHHLKPVILVGHRGVTETVIQALHDALDQHELIKVKFNEGKTKSEKESMVETMSKGVSAQFVGMVGHTAILFRQNSVPQKQRISLPTRPVDLLNSTDDE